MGTLLLHGIVLAAGLVVLAHAGLQLDLLRAARRRPPPAVPADDTVLPRVLVQLPVYNEPAVVERLLDAVAALQYPTGRWRIQILDDSTDETPDLIAAWLRRDDRPDVPVEHVRRTHRTDFKAGALQAGLEDALTRPDPPEVIAVLDADFLPAPDFLQRTAPGFQDPAVAVVQGRWGHLNADASWLTRSQAIMLDAHFDVEQAGRQALGCFGAFNGSGGLIRVSALLAVGGWRAGTLTEDLDLSIRLQLHGWRIRFDPSIVVPAELPEDLDALRIQQHRWMRGVAQNARHHLGSVGTAPPRARLHLAGQLLESATFAAITVLLVLNAPMALLVADSRVPVGAALNLPLLLGFIALAPVYLFASAPRLPSWRSRLQHYGQFTVFAASQTIPNAVAVGAGWLGGAGVFERTAKRGGAGAQAGAIRPRTAVELAVAVCIIAGVITVALRAPAQLWLLWPGLAWLAGSVRLLLHSSRPRPRHS